MKYRMWVTEPINQDQANLYLVRYHDDVAQDYFRDGQWHRYPMMGSVEPAVVFPGRDYEGRFGDLVTQLTINTRRGTT